MDQEKKIIIEVQTEGVEDTQKKIDDLGKSTDTTGKTIDKHFSGLNKILSKFGTSVGQLATNFGKGFSSMIKSVANFSKTLLTTPIGWISAAVGALVGIFMKLKEAFAKNDAASTSLSKAFAVFKPILDGVNKIFNGLAGVVGKVAEGFANLAASIFPAVKATTDLVQAQDDLEQAERDALVAESERNKEIAKLRDLATDAENQTFETRKEALKKAIELEEQNLLDQKDILAERLRLLEEEAKANSDTSDETAKKIAEARAALNNAEASYFTNHKRLSKELTAIDKEEAAALKAQEDEKAAAAKRAAEERKKRLEEAEKEQKRLSDLYKETTDTIKNLLSDAETNEYISLENQFNQIGAQLEELYNKGKVSEEEYLTYTNQLQAKYNEDKLAINDKYRQAEFKANEESLQTELALELLMAENSGNQRGLTEQEIQKELHEIRLAGLEKQMSLYDTDTIEYQKLLKQKTDLIKEFTDNENKILEQSAAVASKATEDKFNAIKQGFEGLKSALDVFNEINNTISVQEDAELERYKENNRAKQEILEQRLNNGLISQELYEQQMHELQAESDKKEAELKNKQAKRTKAFNIANATIAFSVAMVEAVQAAMAAAAATGPAAIVTGPIFTSVMTALAAATAGAALATAIATPIPKAAKGGIAGGGLLQGPSHKEGGIHIEAEGGEAIINKRSTAKYAELLSAINQAGGGVAFSGSRKRVFATGGLVNDGGYSLRGVSKAVKYPPIYVTVEDINRGQRDYANIINSRTL